MHDKRKVRRRHLLYYLRLTDAVTTQAIGDLEDITPEGLMLAGGAAIEPGREYRMRMNLPHEIFRNPELEFTAQCIWCRFDPKIGRHRMGFSLVDIRNDEIETIVSLITEYGAPE